MLSDVLRSQLREFVREQLHRDWLREHGRRPNRRALFIGPSGAGKTLTAETLASELKLPLLVIRFESLITRFMGETAAKLRLVLTRSQENEEFTSLTSLTRLADIAAPSMMLRKCGVF